MNIKKMVGAFITGLVLLSQVGYGQKIFVNLSGLESQELTPDNIFNYQISNNTGSAKQADITGTLRYKNSGMRFSYVLHLQLSSGVNNLSKDKGKSATWDFSESALRELFFNYGKLPQGTYEYCVQVKVKDQQSELDYGPGLDECIYNRVSDIFLINLVDPENDAKLHEYNPMLSWVVNYPFASQLTYRIRVAELKKGQNNENAIVRNNPVYTEKNITSTSKMYPVTGRPLQKFQPYVWTVDAYYKSILLGGAEVWKFTIIEDSLMVPINADQSYYDFAKHMGDTKVYAVGELKLKYKSDDPADTFDVKLFNRKHEEIPIKTKRVPIYNGTNLFSIIFFEKENLAHLSEYMIELTATDKKRYQVAFTYANPLFIKK